MDAPFSGSRRWRWSFSGIFWLVFLTPAIQTTLNSDRDIAVKAATLVCFALFIALYLLSVPLTASRPWNDPVRYLTPVAALVLGLLTIPVAGTSLYLVDQYVTARTLSTPLSLIA